MSLTARASSPATAVPVIAALALTATVSACGNAAKKASTASARASIAAGAFDPCATLTAGQVKSAFGGTVKTGTPSTTTAGLVCSWTVTKDSLVGAGQVTVRDAMMTADQFALSKQALVAGQTPTAVPVTGVGTDAFYSPGVDALTVLANGRTLVVQATGSGRRQNASKIKSALLSLGRLAAALR